MHVHRSPADLGHIVRNVISGVEPRDAIEKIIREARGDKLAADETDALSALAKLAETVAAGGAAFKQRLAELKKATEEPRAQIVAAGRERAAVSKLKADAEAERAKHDTTVAKELKEHQAKLTAANAELAALKTQADNALAKALADAKKSEAIRKDLERRLDLIRAA